MFSAALRLHLQSLYGCLPTSFAWLEIMPAKMPVRTAAPVSTIAMSDVEKSLGAQPPTTVPHKVETEKPLSDDQDSAEVAEEKPEKEKEGSIKDYFVSN